MEYSMLKFARLIGIDVPEFKLIPTASIRNLPEGVGNIYGETLAVKRFDRADGGQRVHMEDFAQVFELYPEQKYKQLSYGAIGSALYTVTGEKGLVEYISRLVFNIAIGNSDMHAKNWSLLYSDPRKPTLSPAYDLVATIAYTKKNVELAFHIGNEKRLSRISMEHFSKMAQKALLPERMVKRIVKDTSELIVEGWNKEKTNLGIPGEGLNVIEQNMMNSELFHRYFRKTS
jgi:serine/threonine-protein kinase HipA